MSKCPINLKFGKDCATDKKCLSTLVCPESIYRVCQAKTLKAENCIQPETMKQFKSSVKNFKKGKVGGTFNPLANRHMTLEDYDQWFKEGHQ